jgi:soluble lytic murein transglycosylase-like protein
MFFALVAAMAPPAAAQQADWATAGGDMFGSPPPAVSGSAEAPASARLEPLSQPYQRLIDEAAVEHGLDPKLLHALVVTESAYRPGAVSTAGAGGLTQLMPATARELGVGDRFDPAQNVRGGADYLARQIRRFGDLRLALAAYNAGPARVARLGRVPDIPETRDYVEAVISCFLALTAGRAVTNSQQCLAGEARL